MIDYADSIKAARMGVVRDALAGGSLELLESGKTLVRIPLQQPVLLGALLSFAVSEGYAYAKGEPDSARMVSAEGRPVVESLDIGTDVVLDDDRVDVGQAVRMISAALRHA